MNIPKWLLADLLCLALWPEAARAQAEPLYKRSLTMLEKALGPEHPNVATKGAPPKALEPS